MSRFEPLPARNAEEFGGGSDPRVPAARGRRIDHVPETRFGVWFQDSDTWNRYVLHPALELLFDLARGLVRPAPVVLDAGCGRAASLDWLASRVAPSQVHAVDCDPDVLESARRRALAHSFPVRVHCCPLERLELEDASVDVVLCHQCLHHASDQDAVLGEFRRILKPDGVLLLGESCWPFLKRIVVRLLFRHPPTARRLAGDYLAMLADHGFGVDPARIAFPRPMWSMAREFAAERATELAPLCMVAATAGGPGPDDAEDPGSRTKIARHS